MYICGLCIDIHSIISIDIHVYPMRALESSPEPLFTGALSFSICKGKVLHLFGASPLDGPGRGGGSSPAAGGGPPCDGGCAFVLRPERVVTMLLVLVFGSLVGSLEGACLSRGHGVIGQSAKHQIFDSHLPFNSKRCAPIAGLKNCAIAATLATRPPRLL